MKKVYVVTSGCYSDYAIDRIFSTKDAANLFIALHEDDEWTDYNEVEEWEVDSDTFDGSIEIEFCYTLSFKYYKKKDSFIKNHLSIMPTKKKEENINKLLPPLRMSSNPSLNVYIYLPREDMEEETLKKSYDMIAYWRAKNEGII